VNVDLRSKGRWFIFLYSSVKEVCGITEKVKDEDYTEKVKNENNPLKIYEKYKCNLILY
jgi:hypothetical protein